MFCNDAESPIQPDMYAIVSADEKLLLGWQDQLDSYFQGRIVDVRNALRNQGWEGEISSQILTKKKSGENLVQFSMDYSKVGAGANVVGVTYILRSEGCEHEERIIDTLQQHPEQLAQTIDLRRRAFQTQTQSQCLKALLPFVSNQQMHLLRSGTHGEEKGYFRKKIEEYAKRVSRMPATYEQDGKGDDATAYLHYFFRNWDWFITERDMLDEQAQTFGWTMIDEDPENAELGYISINEITEVGAELDLHWQPVTLRELKKEHADRKYKSENGELDCSCKRRRMR